MAIWAKIMTSLRDHPKAVEAGPEAMWLYVCMILYAKERETNGRVAKSVLQGINAQRRKVPLIRRLVDAGLVKSVDDDWRIVNYRIDHRARCREADGFASDAQIEARVALYGGMCWMCREKPYEVMDHVKPLVSGGSCWPSNLRPACTSCNARKGGAWPFPTMREAA